MRTLPTPADLYVPMSPQPGCPPHRLLAVLLLLEEQGEIVVVATDPALADAGRRRPTHPPSGERRLRGRSLGERAALIEQARRRGSRQLSGGAGVRTIHGSLTERKGDNVAGWKKPGKAEGQTRKR